MAILLSVLFTLQSKVNGTLVRVRGRNIPMVGAGLAEVPPGCDSAWCNGRLEWVGCSHSGNGPPDIYWYLRSLSGSFLQGRSLGRLP